MRVFIQRGHCFRRTGSTGTAGSGTSEQAYVDNIARRAVTLLQRAGHHAVAALADTPPSHGYDVFVALHCDGSTSRAASGASIGYRTPNGRAAGETWKRRYAARGWPYGFRPNNYTTALARYYGTAWAADAGIPHAFILEHGFLTNPTADGPFLTSEDGRTIAAYALFDTVQILSGGAPIDSNEQEDDMIGKNSSGHEVEEWQQTLYDWGNDERLGNWTDWRLERCGMKEVTRNDWVDGDYGELTVRATRFLQDDLWVQKTGEPTVQLMARVEAKKAVRGLTPADSGQEGAPDGSS